MINTNFNPFPELTAGRFHLRQLTIDDDAEILTLRTDARVIRYLGRAPAESIYEARDFIKKIVYGISENEWIHWVITEHNSNNLIGTICLWNINRERYSAEIGFELLPAHMGKGIMQEVIPVIIDFGFKKMNLKYIDGEVDPLNIKSIKLMEHFGFIYNRELEKTVVYSLLNKDSD